MDFHTRLVANTKYSLIYFSALGLIYISEINILREMMKKYLKLPDERSSFS